MGDFSESGRSHEIQTTLNPQLVPELPFRINYGIKFRHLEELAGFLNGLNIYYSPESKTIKSMSNDTASQILSDN